jgi:hypothetical protein
MFTFIIIIISIALLLPLASFIFSLVFANDFNPKYAKIIGQGWNNR